MSFFFFLVTIRLLLKVFHHFIRFSPPCVFFSSHLPFNKSLIAAAFVRILQRESAFVKRALSFPLVHCLIPHSRTSDFGGAILWLPLTRAANKSISTGRRSGRTKKKKTSTTADQEPILSYYRRYIERLRRRL